MTLERPERKVRKTQPSKGANTDQWSRSPHSRVGATGALDTRELLISDSWAEPTLEPSSLTDVKSQEHPAATPQWPY
jgi:hypothetical protein